MEGNLLDQEIKRLYFGFLAGWNRRDAREIAELFTIDANVIGFDGSQMNGRDEIGAELSQVFQDHKTAAYLGIVREVRTLAPDVVLLRAVVGMVSPGETSINPAVNAIQTMAATRANDAWRIALLQTTPAAFHGRPDAAAQLTADLQGVLLSRGLPGD